LASVQRVAAHGVANQAQGGEADVGGHAANLAVASFIKGDFQPAGGNGFAFANRRVARPQPLRLIHAFNTGGQGGAIVERDAVAQRPAPRRGFAFNLNIVNFAGAFTRLRQLRLQRAVVGQHQQPFAVAVQTPGRVDP
jgi:hypothetical protein